MKTRILWLLLRSQTSAVRLWFSLASLWYAIFLYYSPLVPDTEKTMMFSLAPVWVWALGYFIHFISMMYGVLTRKFNSFLLFTEGVLGASLWIATAISTWVTQSAPSATLAGAFVALWLLIRYPTHWEKNDD